MSDKNVVVFTTGKTTEERFADLEWRFVHLTRLVFKLSTFVVIPYWAESECQELLKNVVLGRK